MGPDPGGSLATEELDDVVPAAAALVPGRQHQRLLGLEQDVGGPLDRPVDPQLLRITPIELSEQLHDAAPDVCWDELDLAKAAFLNRAQQPIGLPQLVLRRASRLALPGPKTLLGDLQNG